MLQNVLQNRDIYVHELNFVSCYLYHSSMTTKKEQEKTENKKTQARPNKENHPIHSSSKMQQVKE